MDVIKRARQPVLLTVEDDTPQKNNPGPAGFDPDAVQWMVQFSAFQIVWAADWDVPGWKDAARIINLNLDAGRPVLLILTRQVEARAWVDTVERHALTGRGAVSPTVH